MSPPGKKSGVTTYASVVKARRTPLISTTAWSSSFSSTSLRNAGRKQRELARDLETVHEVRRLAARAERQRHVITAAEQTKLVAEDLGEVAVVRDRREQRGVGGQRERRQRAPLLEDRVAELHRHVLGVGGAAAVAHDVEPAAALEGRRHRARQGLDALGLHAEECLLDRSTLARLAEDRLLHGAAASRCRPYA